MESLLEEDSTPSKSAASKRKLKKDRRLKRQEQEMEDAAQTGGEVTWDEDQVSRSPRFSSSWALTLASPPRPTRAHSPGAVSHALALLW